MDSEVPKRSSVFRLFQILLATIHLFIAAIIVFLGLLVTVLSFLHQTGKKNGDQSTPQNLHPP